MEVFRLVAEPRTLTGKKVRQLRAQGYVPAVLYGSQAESVPVMFEQKELQRVLREAGTNHLVAIQLGDESEERTTLVRDIQYDAIRQTVRHVDFLQVVKGEKITTEVSIELVGETEVEGTILQDLNSVEIACLPTDLIAAIQVDISMLKGIDDMITVKDLQVPDSITILDDPDTLVVHTEAFREMEAEEPEPLPFEVGEVRLVSDDSAAEPDFES